MIQCALAGAVALCTAALMLQGYSWIGRSPESGGIAHNAVWLGFLLVETLFRTPWGACGALLGAAAGWLTLRRPRRASPSTSPPHSL